MTSSNSIDKEISNRIAKASASYGRLHKRVWSDRGLTVETKCAVYRAVVLTALLYGCESWTLYRRHVKSLEQFHQRCLRRIMNIKWYNRVSNIKVLNKVKMPSIDALLLQSQLRWSGHLVRMGDDRIPKQLFYCELAEGHRQRGRPKLRFKDTLRQSLQKANIDSTHWETKAGNRSGWRRVVRSGAKAYEKTRQHDQVKKREITKSRALTAEPLRWKSIGTETERQRNGSGTVQIAPIEKTMSESISTERQRDGTGSSAVPQPHFFNRTQERFCRCRRGTADKNVGQAWVWSQHSRENAMLNCGYFQFQDNADVSRQGDY